MLTGHLFPSLQGLCVSCLFCFANMDVHYAMLPLLKLLFRSGSGGDSATTAQKANTVTHSVRDLGVWLCCRTRRTISERHGQELEVYWPEASITVQLGVNQLHYSVQTHCHWAILCSCCSNYLMLTTEMTRQTAVWTSSISSLTAFRSILLQALSLDLTLKTTGL
jgi:hypothetical protein